MLSCLVLSYLVLSCLVLSCHPEDFFHKFMQKRKAESEKSAAIGKDLMFRLSLGSHKLGRFVPTKLQKSAFEKGGSGKTYFQASMINDHVDQPL